MLGTSLCQTDTIKGPVATISAMEDCTIKFQITMNYHNLVVNGSGSFSCNNRVYYLLEPNLDNGVYFLLEN